MNKIILIILGVSLSVNIISGCANRASKNDQSDGDSLVIKDAHLPVNRITSGTRQHWFGYYDKLQVDPSGRYALGMEIDTIFRSPTQNDTVKIGLIDLENGNSWKEIGRSTSWGWQQGCMLQWIPGSAEEIIWNDREKDKFISRVYNFKTGETRILPKAIYALSLDGKFAVGTEFNRIQNMRPGYGYPGINDPYASEKAPSEIGIYNMDLQTGEYSLIISLSQVAAIPNEDGPIPDRYYHYFNHLLVSPDSKRLIFLHRYRDKMPVPGSSGGGFITRMFTANVDGSGLYMLDPSGNTSISFGKIRNMLRHGHNRREKIGVFMNLKIKQIIFTWWAKKPCL